MSHSRHAGGPLGTSTGETAGGLTRRAVSAGLLAAATGWPARAGPARDLQPRHIIEALHKTPPGITPDLTAAALAGFDLTGIDLKSARLVGADLFGATLTDANLAGCDLTGARLDRAVITRTEFSGAHLVKASLLNLTVFTTLERHHTERARFAGARMDDADISGHLDYCDFRWADLRSTRFGTGGAATTLLGADFSEADLTGAALGGAPLTFARFKLARLFAADLSGCQLSKADFRGAAVNGMSVAGADLNEALFVGAHGLRELRGLEQARNAHRMNAQTFR